MNTWIPLFIGTVWKQLCIKMVFPRKLAIYVITMFLPSIALVVLSWVGFWVDKKAVPARSGLSITTILATITLINGNGTRLNLSLISRRENFPDNPLQLIHSSSHYWHCETYFFCQTWRKCHLSLTSPHFKLEQFNAKVGFSPAKMQNIRQKSWNVARVEKKIGKICKISGEKLVFSPQISYIILRRNAVKLYKFTARVSGDLTKIHQIAMLSTSYRPCTDSNLSPPA